MITIELTWKEFSVKLDKVHAHLKSILSSNYDGLVADSISLKVIFKAEISEDDTEVVTNYWDNTHASDFNPTQAEVITQIINNAIIFGNKIIFDAIVENVALGITQSGKTKVISDYFRALQRYLKEGSLFAAIDEINNLINNGIPEEFAPFVTETRMTTYKQKLQQYLGIS